MWWENWNHPFTAINIREAVYLLEGSILSEKSRGRFFFFFSIPTNILVTRNLINWHFTWKIHRCARCWRITWILEYTSLETLKPYTYRYGLELSGLFSTIRTFYCFTFQNTKNNDKLVLLLWLLSCWWWTVSSGL